MGGVLFVHAVSDHCGGQEDVQEAVHYAAGAVGFVGVTLLAADWAVESGAGFEGYFIVSAEVEEVRQVRACREHFRGFAAGAYFGAGAGFGYGCQGILQIV